MELFGLEQAPFNIASLVGMGWVEGLGLSSIAFIMIVATYRSMDPALEEAARVHGLGILRTLRYVTLPLTFPGIIAASIYIFTIGLSAFEVPAIIGMSNKIFTFSTFIFYKIQPQEELPSYGMAGRGEQSVGRPGALVELGLFSHVEVFPSLRGGHRQGLPAATGGVGPARLAFWPGLFWAVSFTVAKLLPFLLLSGRRSCAIFSRHLGRRWRRCRSNNFYGLPWNLLFHGAWNTVLLMVDGADANACFMCLAISWTVLRSGLRLARALRCRGVFAPCRAASDSCHRRGVRALFLLRDVVSLYGSLMILIIVYTISRISFATRIINNSLAQIHPELEEAAFVGGLPLLAGDAQDSYSRCCGRRWFTPGSGWRCYAFAS